MIKITDAKKNYNMGEIEVPVLRGVTISISKGEFVAIMGASGSGKTTLLNIIGCLDRLDSGSYQLDNKPVHMADNEELAHIRNEKIGFVFQLFNLIPSINSLRNVELPMVYSGVPTNTRFNRAKDMLALMGIEDRIFHRPSQLSGGQQQRIAIARALVNQPKILVADEPTGSLDSENSIEIMKLFTSLNQDGMTIVMVTHEIGIAEFAERIIYLKDGKVAR